MADLGTNKSESAIRIRRRTVFGAALAGAVLLDLVIVGILIAVKGLEDSLAALASGVLFTIIVVLYWSRGPKEDGYSDNHAGG